MSLSIIFRIARFYSAEFWTYPLETLALVVRRVFMVGLLVLFWHLVAQDNDIEGLQILPYILIASGVQFLTVGQNFRQAHDISDDVKFGRLNNLLVKPIGELRYEMGAYLGRNVFEVVFSVANIGLGLWLASDVGVGNLGLFVLALIPALVIGYAMNIATASAAFWLVETTYFRLLVYFMLRIISGMFIPLTFFAGTLGMLLQYAPFAQVAFVPSFVMTGDDMGKAVLLVAVGFIQAPIALKMAYMLWAKGLRRYEAVGI